jgi:hypothetical protein
MGFESKGLARFVLVTLLGYVAVWLCLAVLIVVSITSGNQVALGLLLAWALIAAGWLGIYAPREYAGTRWWQLVLMAPVMPVLVAITGAARAWKR